VNQYSEDNEIKDEWTRLKKLSPQIAEWYVAGLFSLYGVILLAHKAVPSLTDYSNWIYQGVLLRNHILDIPDPWHILKVYPVPNSLTTVGIAGLALLFRWQMAAKLWLCALLFLSFLSAGRMIRATGNNAVLWLIVPSSLFLNVNLWYGFTNFQFGLCWLLFIACFLLKEDKRDWILGLLLVLCFFSHMIPFAFACLLVFFYAVHFRRLRLLWQLVPGILLSAWYLLGRFYLENNADGQAGMVSAVRTYSGAFWAYKVNSYLKSFGFINPVTPDGSIALQQFGTGIFLVLHFLNLVLCGVIAYCLASAMISGFRDRTKERFVWVAGSLFFVLFLLVPGTALGISDPGSRLLQATLAVTVFIGLSQGKLPTFARRTAVVCALCLQASALVLFLSAVFTPEVKGKTAAHLSTEVLLFAHVPIHMEDVALRALEMEDMKLQIFPTALFLNRSNSNSPISPSSPTDKLDPYGR
jgi:hypothetical protein